MKRSAPLLCALVLLSACETRMIPRPDPGWMPLGGTQTSMIALDTTRIGQEADARLVWLRLDSMTTNAEGDPVTVPSARRESLHRVRCGALTVADLRIGSDQPRDVPGPGGRDTVDSVRAFASHPYGPEVFPTVCNAVGLVLSRRAEAP